MANLTNKNIDFLSNQEVINILLSILNEIDMVANIDTHRSTTYLAVSAIEGLFTEILKLRQISTTKEPDNLLLREKFTVLQSTGEVISEDFQSLFAPLIDYRNYMHPSLEKSKSSITKSVAQRAIASLNSLIEQYENLRFIANQEWRLMCGIAQVPDIKSIHMPQNPDDLVSLLISEQKASYFKEISFHVIIPRDAVFNFIYNFQSINSFTGARIEGHEQNNNGRFRCVKWRTWPINAHYITYTPSAKQRHTVRIVLNPPENFALIVDGIELELEDNTPWGFHANKKIGFMTELGLVSILGMKIGWWPYGELIKRGTRDKSS
ncbi:MAG: hypothetical protein GC179_13795 [Anaerolineaceae bacterium]|nr:hypothetical protein [Anaerolineaceae bacterium]